MHSCNIVTSGPFVSAKSPGEHVERDTSAGLSELGTSDDSGAWPLGHAAAS